MNVKIKCLLINIEKFFFLYLSCFVFRWIYLKIWLKYDFENFFGFSWYVLCVLVNNRILIYGGYDGDFVLEDIYIFSLGN